jgi:hypothetical protein
MNVKLIHGIRGKNMPIGEYRGITLRKKVVERLETIAASTNRTVPGLIEHMLDTQYPDPHDNPLLYSVAMNNDERE